MTEKDIKNIQELFNFNKSFEFEFISNNEEDTKKLGKEFAKYISIGKIITLNGELGCGKTVLLMGLASYFNLENEVCSPTFTIVNEYNTKDFPIYHFDVYRLKNSDEFLEGVGTDYFYNGACIIEWGDEVIEDILPKDTIHINITKSDTNPTVRTFRIWRK